MNSFVIADPSLCIGCRTCEVACAVSHQSGSCSGTLEREGGLHLAIEDGHLVSKDSYFQPRLKVIVGSKVTTPVLCRQCEDKPCAMACPNNAIVSEDGCVKVHQERCIGCKSCVVACPYGAMAVVVKEAAPAADSLFKRPQTKAQALKCDLCRHRESGPACVEVCPTQALRLVTPESLGDLNRQKQLASAEAMAVCQRQPVSA
ncbi:electron transporter HydN [Aeromonas sp. YN13HZO-058]|uniref:4Fe-4S dicluster domain-containing protein n=1 Tax=Aeromonas sp. YN13HZO-058 TaxID=1921564 RepID=UPI000946F33B|nr:4Fe-4S dicluster domain-containing protein [Aeromonas sp. YN13HZO-058]OLF19726.1 electron transporter HydN [Aeromonas sp. YN13HZO-058]